MSYKMETKKAENIIKKLKKGQSIKKISIEEKINRYSISLIKQTMLIYENKIKNLENEIKNLKTTINFLLIISITSGLLILSFIIYNLIKKFLWGVKNEYRKTKHL